MTGAMIADLLLPSLGLMLLAFVVTRGVEMLVPETVLGLAVMALVSAMLCWVLASAGFAVLYGVQDGRILALLGQTPSTSAGHFLRLGAKAALLWAPILLLTVSTAPRRWKTAVW
ncbi:hypothetical protein ANTHELSMS3_00847 [Antarctobacter heliothermus]|uniref:Uncharacterized protein n=2 Tax=Antarctobacter heliothermus TaxID=74033 RepID=A0A222E025_9RHOB|nr:hypothetical protein ANTHELSMS3_00847 [Antarctobacter heliothermus]